MFWAKYRVLKGKSGLFSWFLSEPGILDTRFDIANNGNSKATRVSAKPTRVSAVLIAFLRPSSLLLRRGWAEPTSVSEKPTGFRIGPTNHFACLGLHSVESALH